MSPSNVADTRGPCPTRDVLSAFQNGALPTEELEAVGMHLNNCPTCESLMHAVAASADPLVLSLRDLAGSAPTPDEQRLRDEMRTLEQELDEVLPGAANGQAALPMPSRLGEYQLLEKVGEGGMGAVYRALHMRLNKVVALKVVRDGRGAQRLARFGREMRASGMLRHPNIVEATDAGEEQGVHFLVLEYVDGIDLARLAKRIGPLPIAAACEMARQAALGLQHAHEHGLVHRDVKPSNLLLGGDGQVKLADLGLVSARRDEQDSLSTTSDCVVGSLDYLAPEQADDPHGADARADLYALGCTLYHLLSGQPPFAVDTGRTALQKLKAHAVTPAPALAGLRPDVPAPLARIVHKLLAKRPCDRFANAADVAAALQPFAAGADLRRLAHGEEPTVRIEPPRRRRRHRGPVLVGGVLAAAAVLAGIVLYLLTDNGVLEILSDDPDVQVRVEQLGKTIVLLDAKTNKETRLGTGAYQLKLLAGGDDLEMKPGVVVLKRGRKEIVTIKRVGGGLARPLGAKWPALEPAWVKKVGSLTPDEQAAEIVAELKRRNPGFAPGQVQTTVDDGELRGITLIGAAKLIDLSPVRAAPHLRSLVVFEDEELADITPLAGLKLTYLALVNTRITDLSPLKGMQIDFLILSRCVLLKDIDPLLGMPLATLDLSSTAVTDLTPLASTVLRNFSCADSKVKDLRPLAKLKSLEGLNCSSTGVSDLEPLADLPVRHLECHRTLVKDLSPLKKLPLRILNIEGTRVTDFAPLRELPLEELTCDLNPQRDRDVLGAIRGLKKINGQPASKLLR